MLLAIAVHGSKSTTVVQERLNKLPEWLMAVSRHPAVSLHPYFRAFLGLDQHERDLRTAVKASHQDNIQSSQFDSDAVKGSKANLEQQEAVFQQKPSQTSITSDKETAEAKALPSAMDPVTRTAKASVPAPVVAKTEVAHEEVEVDVKLPKPDLTKAKRLVEHASEDVAKLVEVTSNARDLDEKAVRAELYSEKLAVAARQLATEAAVASEQRDAILREAADVSQAATQLEKEAAERRKRANELSELARQRDTDMRKLERLAEQRMEQYNKVLREAERLTDAARNAHKEAKMRQLEALDEHERAASEMLRCKHGLRLGCSRMIT